MLSECPKCRGRIFHALGMNGIRFALDRQPEDRGEFVISSGRAAKWTEHVSPNTKRYRQHKCGGKQ